jgi:hypothetical protein
MTLHVTVTVLDIIHCPVIYLKTMFRRLDYVSFFRWYLLIWTQWVELICVSPDRSKMYRSLKIHVIE